MLVGEPVGLRKCYRYDHKIYPNGTNQSMARALGLRAGGTCLWCSTLAVACKCVSPLKRYMLAPFMHSPVAVIQ